MADRLYELSLGVCKANEARVSGFLSLAQTLTSVGGCQYSETKVNRAQNAGISQPFHLEIKSRGCDTGQRKSNLPREGNHGNTEIRCFQK